MDILDWLSLIPLNIEQNNYGVLIAHIYSRFFRI